MTPIEQIKEKSAADRKFWVITWLLLVALSFVLESAFGYDWVLSIIAALIIPFQLFQTARQAKITGDQYLIFSHYRLIAIIMTFAFSNLFIAEALKKAGFIIGLSTINLILVSLATALATVTLYDRLSSKGDAE